MTPTSLPRKRGQHITQASVEWTAGDGGSVFNDTVLVATEISLEITAGNPLATRGCFHVENAFAVYWDEDIIGLVCLFCIETELYIMPRSNNITAVDLRIPDCDTRKRFRLLFPGDDHPAVNRRRGVWVEERRRWESVYVEDLSEESEQESEAGGALKDTTANYSDFVEALTEEVEDQPGEETLLLAADNRSDLPVALFGNDSEPLADRSTPQNSEILLIASSLTKHPPPKYLTLGHS